MREYLVAYGIALVVIAILDLVWLGFIAMNLYREGLGALMADPIRVGPAAIFYVVYPIGLVIFAMAPTIGEGEWLRAALLGGLFGFFAYFTYDMTNLATLKGYPASLAAIDTAWGTVLSAVTAAVSVAVTRRILG